MKTVIAFEFSPGCAVLMLPLCTCYSKIHISNVRNSFKSSYWRFSFLTCTASLQNLNSKALLFSFQALELITWLLSTQNYNLKGRDFASIRNARFIKNCSTKFYFFVPSEASTYLSTSFIPWWRRRNNIYFASIIKARWNYNFN